MSSRYVKILPITVFSLKSNQWHFQCDLLTWFKLKNLTNSHWVNFICPTKGMLDCTKKTVSPFVDVKMSKLSFLLSLMLAPGAFHELISMPIGASICHLLFEVFISLKTWEDENLWMDRIRRLKYSLYEPLVYNIWKARLKCEL